MEVTYTTTLDDYVAFSLHVLKRSPSMKWRLALGWALIPIGCWLWAALLAGSNPPTALLLSAGGAGYALIYPLVGHRVPLLQLQLRLARLHPARQG